MVVGYVVGEPVATNTVNRTSFTADDAIALADTAGETNTAKMLYVQLTTQWRSGFGLKTNPSLMGQQVSATGSLTAYFSHPGLKSPTAMSGAGSTPPPTPTGTSTTSPYDSTYYASAVGRSPRYGVIGCLRTSARLARWNSCSKAIQSCHAFSSVMP